MSQERTATLKGNPITLIGPVLKAGDSAPDFTLNKNLLETSSLKDFAGKVKLISVVPSIDTGVCDAQTRRFNEEASKLGDNVVIKPFPRGTEMDAGSWVVQDGIVVIPKDTVIPSNTRIEPAT